MGRFRVAALACACLLLAACGGTATKQASIRRTTAIQLADESDAVAAALRRGDSCSAASRAGTLRLRVANAIAAGSIPPSLATPARIAASRLARIVCTQPAPSPTAAASLSCAQIDARKKALEQEKHGPGKHQKGPADAARRHQNDQEEHALDQQQKACK
jgi:hypothetical protein